MLGHVFWPKRGRRESYGRNDTGKLHKMSRRIYWDRSWTPKPLKSHKREKLLNQIGRDGKSTQIKKCIGKIHVISMRRHDAPRLCNIHPKRVNKLKIKHQQIVF